MVVKASPPAFPTVSAGGLPLGSRHNDCRRSPMRFLLELGPDRGVEPTIKTDCLLALEAQSFHTRMQVWYDRINGVEHWHKMSKLR